jgi:hypothetical protein
MWSLGPEEYQERLSRGREIWQRRNEGRPAPKPLSEEDLEQKERLESFLALAVRDVETTTGLRITHRVLPASEWELEHLELDFLALSYEEEEAGSLDEHAQIGRVEEEDDDDDYYYPPLVVEVAGTSQPWHTDRSDAEVLADVAELVQEVVIDELQGAWPTCPGHPHPAEPAVVSGTAVWACMLRSRPVVIAGIGQLPAV